MPISQLLGLVTPFLIILIVLPAIAIQLLLRQFRRATDLKLEERLQIWDLFMKGLPLVTASLAGVVAFIEYVDTRKSEIDKVSKTQANELIHEQNELAQRTREFNAKFYQPLSDRYSEKFAFYNEAVDIASTLAIQIPGDPEYCIARSRFMRMYWGQMTMIERRSSSLRTRLVASRMVDFRDALLREERRFSAFKDNQNAFQKRPDDDEESLEQITLRLAKACAEDLGQEEGARAGKSREKH